VNAVVTEALSQASSSAVARDSFSRMAFTASAPRITFYLLSFSAD